MNQFRKNIKTVQNPTLMSHIINFIKLNDKIELYFKLPLGYVIIISQL